MEIVLDSLLEEWNQVQRSLKDRLSALNFNSLTEEMLLERERLYTIMGIRCTCRSTRKLDLVAKFIPWYDECELNRPANDDDDDIDDIIWYPDYVPTL